MPLVQVTIVEGRGREMMARLIRELTSAVVLVTGVSPKQVRVLIYELPAENWGMGGKSKADA